MKSEIEKKSILSGEVEVSKDDDSTYKELKKVDAGNGEQVIVKNPFTGKEVSVFVDRRGTTDEKVAAVMLDPSMKREHKDLIVSQWLFERGLESASFLAELYSYKGQHTKETRAFKSQMRFDYELIVQSLLSFYRSTSQLMFGELFPRENLDEVKKNYLAFVQKKKENGEAVKLSDFMGMNGVDMTVGELAIMQNIFQMSIEADLLDKKVESVTKSRMAEKGWGIYIDTKGKPYSLQDDDILDVVREDKERMEELKKEENYDRATKSKIDEGTAGEGIE